MEVLAGMAAESVQCIVTSPPYWGLRDYRLEPLVWGGLPDCEHVWRDEIERGGPAGAPGSTSQRINRSNVEEQQRQSDSLGALCSLCGAWRGSLGFEPTPELYVEHMVAVFRELRRVLRDDGVCWLNLGDSYATGAGKVGDHPGGGKQGEKYRGDHGKAPKSAGIGPQTQPNRLPIPGLKPKDLVGIPWRMAFALQADGWWLRSPITWAKGASFGPFNGSVMPESVRDRPTRASEMIFLLSKSKRYFFDQEAVREPLAEGSAERYAYAFGGSKNEALLEANKNGIGVRTRPIGTREATAGRNIRDVWTISPQPFDGEFCTACKRFYDGESKGHLRAVHVCPECGEETVQRYFRRYHRCRHCKLPDSEEWTTKRWCVCGKCDAWLSHLATFPPKIPEIAIQGGTSEHGCCSSCGAPWVRVLDRKHVGDWHPDPEHKHERGAVNGTAKWAKESAQASGRRMVESVKAARKAGADHDHSFEAPETLGWRPSCDCGAEVVPCTVLDPFSGAGTTVLVALRLGRFGVGIEANPDYCRMSRRRVESDAPLFNAETAPALADSLDVELQRTLALEAWAKSEHDAGNPMGIRGMEDAVMEQAVIAGMRRS